MPGQSFGAREALLTEFIGRTTILVHQGGWSYGPAGQYQSLLLILFVFLSPFMVYPERPPR